jgi:hypothetical protein
MGFYGAGFVEILRDKSTSALAIEGLSLAASLRI